MNKLSSNSKIAVIGLGYVGLPLAVEFSKKYNVIGFDINAVRIQELQSGIDRTLELETSELKKANNIKYTSDLISWIFWNKRILFTWTEYGQYPKTLNLETLSFDKR